MEINNPLLVIFTDLHIKLDNTAIIENLVKQAIEVARHREITTLVVLGDVFQSRQAQPLIVIKCFERILNMIDEAGMKLYGIPGNHDKTNYESHDSFLDQFRWHPAFELSPNLIQIDVWKFYFLPFYNPGKYLEQLSILNEGVTYTNKEILFTHTAFEGSINNDGSTVSTPIKPNLFENFYKVFSGHYHNQQQISSNIYHLASIRANNYGEDNEKGFYVFNGDGSHELIVSKFPEYHTIKINLDEVNKEDINEITKQAKELIDQQGANIRFDFEGSQDKVQMVKKEDFTVLGVDVRKKNSIVVKSIERAQKKEVISYNKENIKEKFESFCKEEKYDNINYGSQCLTKILEKNG